ncbi:MAG: four helix bundle protein [Chloroflexia bacterium]
MTFHEWLASVPEEITKDALWRLEVYRLALFAGDLAWQDAGRVVGDRRTVGLADQLYRAVGSISANIAEGYSRSSGRDQARFYEYALGSAREARGWYYQSRHVLHDDVARHRMDLLTQIIRSLLTIIPAERNTMVRDEETLYEITPRTLLDRPPP